MLSVEDRIAIQGLYARYCACLDTGDIEGWANCFSEDGVFDTFQRWVGRKVIHGFGLKLLADRPAKPVTNTQHWNSNLIVEGDGRIAKGMCYLLTVAKDRAGGQLVMAIQGTYEDDLAKLDGRWLFTRRKVHFDTPPASIIPK